MLCFRFGISFSLIDMSVDDTSLETYLSSLIELRRVMSLPKKIKIEEIYKMKKASNGFVSVHVVKDEKFFIVIDKLSSMFDVTLSFS